MKDRKIFSKGSSLWRIPWTFPFLRCPHLATPGVLVLASKETGNRTCQAEDSTLREEPRLLQDPSWTLCILARQPCHAPTSNLALRPSNPDPRILPSTRKQPPGGCPKPLLLFLFILVLEPFGVIQFMGPFSKAVDRRCFLKPRS